MRRTFLLHHGMPTQTLSLVILILGALLLWLPCPSSLSQAQVPPITSSGLNTQVSGPIAVGGQTQFDITGGTRPNEGLNLFHSFGEFGVPTNNIANFLNETALPTSNILGRVTGGNISNIFGTIQTTGFGSANLFLMNPTGFLFGPNATVNVGGIVHFTTADYLRLDEVGGPNAGIFHADLTQPIVLTSAPVAAFGFLGSNPAAIRVEGGTLTLSPETGLSFVGGPITLGVDSESGTPAFISAPGGRIDLVSVASPGEILYPSLQRASNINGQSFTAMGNIAISDFASVDVSGSVDQGDGHGGAIRIRGGQFVMENFSFLTTSTQGDVAGDTSGVSVHVDGAVALRNVSGIVTGTGSGAGRDGGVEIVATNVDIADGSFILTGSSGPAEAGNITIQADTISLTGGLPDEGLITNISTFGGGSVAGGTISLSGRSSSGQTLIISDQGQILTSSLSGRGGDINIEMDNVTVSGGASLVATAAESASAGDILITATESFSLTGLSPGGASAISSISNLSPANISITTGQFLLGEGASINGQTSATEGGRIGISATGSITIQDNSFITSTSNVGTGASLELSAPTILIDQSTLSARSAGMADGGMITAHATKGNLILDHGSVIASSTGGSGTGGSVEVTASDSVLIAGGSRIESKGFSTSGGDAGSLTVRGGTLVTLNCGSSISASSTGTGNAGDILINAGQNYTSTDSAVTTQATQASGGNITVLATDMVQLTNSQLNASVQGSSTTVGGNITIDPQYVILQNSQILAQATQGQGGAISITITNGGLFLPDATSIVSASSQFGVNGTVTIQSPNAPASGKIQPLGKTPLQATSLLNQHCAALAGGEFSSFTVAGRDSLPTEPGSWLASPLATLSAGTGLGAMGQGKRHVARGEGLEGEAAFLSLRQIAPAGFLTQTFALDWSAGCTS